MRYNVKASVIYGNSKRTMFEGGKIITTPSDTELKVSELNKLVMNELPKFRSEVEKEELYVYNRLKESTDSVPEGAGIQYVLYLKDN
jgi:hypothetical protein